MDADFTKIKLPNFIIADLYKDSLVILDNKEGKDAAKPAQVKQEQVLKNTKPATKWFLGDHAKKITILVKEDNGVFLNDESLAFLSTILAACKLNIGDVAIINYQNHPINVTVLEEKLAPACIILFNVTAADIALPFTIPFYQVQSYGGKQFLLAPDLQLMLSNTQEAKLEKSKLWLSLKKMFGI